MKRFLIVATGGAGGDLPPLVAAALAIRERGNQMAFVGDPSLGRALTGVGVELLALPAELDFGPRFARVMREAMAATSGDLVAAGPLIQQGLARWAEEIAKPIRRVVDERRPDAVVTSLFGVEAVHRAVLKCPWAVINSTFYLGANPPRPLQEVVGPRAVPLLKRFAGLLAEADLVLHATDQVFDFCFDRLPPRNHYVGPLGIWEPPLEYPAYLDKPGDPWELVSISSQIQDDVPLAQMALRALADKPVRVMLTLGPDHTPSELADAPVNAHVEQTVSHSAVLERGRLLVSHAGHGSVMKALWYSRPMVLMPWGRDQPGVAARALGVAELVERGKNAQAALADAIDRALVSSEMNKAARAHSVRLRSTDPRRLAATLLESLV